jgi:hypothetical protein
MREMLLVFNAHALAWVTFDQIYLDSRLGVVALVGSRVGLPGTDILTILADEAAGLKAIGRIRDGHALGSRIVDLTGLAVDWPMARVYRTWAEVIQPADPQDPAPVVEVEQDLAERLANSVHQATR